MNDKIVFKIVDINNLKLACKIQNEIFTKEDGSQNYIEQVNGTTYCKEQYYYIDYCGDIPIGISGIYSYHKYPESAWLGWFGVLKDYRNKEYGGIILDNTIKLAKEKNYTKFRLYTDEYATSAHKLYESRGMIKELYDNQNDKDNYIDAKIYIYSLSLNEDKIDKWNNKNIGIKEQSNKEH